MGYRIDYSVSGAVLKAVVSGKSSFAGAIARDIGEQMRASSVRYVLIDVRRLQDRPGRLRTLLAGKHAPKRIAVVDGFENDPYYVFAELAAKSRGRTLRRFDDHAEALSWLRSAE